MPWRFAKFADFCLGESAENEPQHVARHRVARAVHRLEVTEKQHEFLDVREL